MKQIYIISIISIFFSLIAVSSNAQSEEAIDSLIMHSTIINGEGYYGNAKRSFGDVKIQQNGTETVDVEFTGNTQEGEGYVVIEGDLILDENVIFLIDENTLVLVKGNLIVNGSDVLIDLEQNAFLAVSGDIIGKGSAFMVESSSIYLKGENSVNINGVSTLPFEQLPLEGSQIKEEQILTIVMLELGVQEPYGMSYFEATVEGNQALLIWGVKEEEEAVVYIIERSINGLEWEDVAQVISLGVDEQEYSYVDSELKNETYHYRLSKMDVAGLEEELSQLSVLVEKKDHLEAKLLPNYLMTGQEVEVRVNGLKVGDKVDVVVANQQGQIVLELSEIVSDQYANIALHEMQEVPSGLYFISIYDGNNVTNTKALIR
ncbi:hypothetical protein [Flammeovirga kamogawensis]|uniref:T9SS type A sorting domain-containing protein n=1 Tax=Flammeovirga kamogawensis TaxID=373891 RepID=A0ABX8GZB6_9BACT|nr:hypothetical protein [Flammeovirga kamogawensis]MBB6459393.1 hypothetical protein [Flammeovirga kamogawensis]QWG08949.1 hypothetical protein KM029_08390 [Flammeovirga kamogawensis]TRX67239.1 hypothetical protein EO216_03435 [Flammeovirga kamogawensis]